jgi:hypothetical protein
MPKQKKIYIIAGESSGDLIGSYVIKNLKELKEQSNTSCIDCHVKNTYQSVYIDHQGRLWPCCYLAAGLYVTDGLPVHDGWLKLWHTYGNDKINLKNYKWHDILSGGFFNAIQDSWTKDYKLEWINDCWESHTIHKNKKVDGIL